MRLIVSGNASPRHPAPVATIARKNVPSRAEKSRRYSWLGFWKSSIGWMMLCCSFASISTGHLVCQRSVLQLDDSAMLRLDPCASRTALITERVEKAKRIPSNEPTSKSGDQVEAPRSAGASSRDRCSRRRDRSTDPPH